MPALIATAKPRRQIPQGSNGQDDPFALVRDREQVDLISNLDQVYDALIGQALNGGGDGVFQLAATVKMAVNYLVNLRLSAPR
jgi:hypothetical protein